LVALRSRAKIAVMPDHEHQIQVFGHTGAVAFSRTGNPATGEFRDATVLRKFGDFVTCRVFDNAPSVTLTN
jgi:hypothetical protein